MPRPEDLKTDRPLGILVTVRQGMEIPEDTSDTNSQNSPDSPHSPSDSAPVSTNSPHEILIESITYHTRREFGEFCPAVDEWLAKKSSQVGATTLLEPPALPLGDMDTSTDVEHRIHLEMPIDHVIREFIEAQPEAWTQAHLVCHDDRQHGSVVGFTAQALDTLVQDVATYIGFGSEAERDDYAASLRWRIDQGVT